MPAASDVDRHSIDPCQLFFGQTVVCWHPELGFILPATPANRSL